MPLLFEWYPNKFEYRESLVYNLQEKADSQDVWTEIL